MGLDASHHHSRPRDRLVQRQAANLAAAAAQLRAGVEQHLSVNVGGCDRMHPPVIKRAG